MSGAITRTAESFGSFAPLKASGEEAIQLAGARNVLVTLWPLNDGEARDFMGAFYRTWLAQAGRSDPAKALRETRLTYLNNPNPALRDPRVWAPYVLIE